MRDEVGTARTISTRVGGGMPSFLCRRHENFVQNAPYNTLSLP